MANLDWRHLEFLDVRDIQLEINHHLLRVQTFDPRKILFG